MKRKNAWYAAIGALVVTLQGFGEEPFRFAADRPVDCLHIRLDLKVDLANKHVQGRAALEVAALRDVTTISLDAIDLDVVGAAVLRAGGGPQEVDYTNDGKHIEILLDEPLTTGQKATIIIDYSVDNPRSGLHFFGPSRNEPELSPVVWSQGESTTNSYWFPCFDHPNERQTTELIVTTDRAFEVSSNGRLVSKKEDAANDTVTFHWSQDTPHVAYLVSMIVGEFHIERDTWRGKPISYWVHPRFKEQVRRSFRNTKRMLDFFSDKIGIEYPWDRYAQICCEGFGGGMENTSATTLGNRALHDARSFIDANSDGLIAHELAHQWWGDLLTCRDWTHIWLNEGFASYFEALWHEHDLGDDEFRYNMYRKAGRARSESAQKRPIVDRAYESPRSMFDARAYPKGAWVLHMMRKRLGDDLFWTVMNKYGTQNAYQTVETVDLRKVVEQVTGRSFERFFFDWTGRAGHPELTVTYKWLNDDKLAKVTIKQKQEADAFHFPLMFEFRFGDERDPVVVKRDITEKETSFYYPLPEKPRMLRVDPDQSVLMKLEEKKGKDLWKAQLLDDPDPIARIRAAEHFGESKSDGDRELLAGALAAEKFWGVQREIAKALSESGGDIARDALIEGLKFENHKARRACVEQLDSFHKDPVAIDAVRQIVENGDRSYYVEGAAIETYGKLEPADAIDVVKKALSRDSRYETIRRSVLSALSEVRDASVIPLLAEWTKPDKPRLARVSAIRGLARVTKRTHVDDETTQFIVDTIASCLSDTGRWTRRSAARALGSLGEPGKAKSALPALKALVANDADERIRKTAERTIKSIESGEPAQMQLADLRKELKEALEQNEELTDRLDKIESLVGDSATKPDNNKEIAATTPENAPARNE